MDTQSSNNYQQHQTENIIEQQENTKILSPLTTTVNPNPDDNEEINDDQGQINSLFDVSASSDPG